MKRFLPFALALCLLLAACGREKVYTMEGGVLTGPGGVSFLLLDTSFEAAAAGVGAGRYETPGSGAAVSLYEIPGLDPSVFLTDNYAGVYHAGGELDAAALTVTGMLFCEGNAAVSVARFELTGERDAALIAALRALWFEGETAELPVEPPAETCRLKMALAEYPNLYYCVTLSRYADGAFYLTAAGTGRVVRVPAELAAQLPLA